MRRVLLILVVLFWVLFSSPAEAQPEDVGFQGYTKRLWNAQDGLPDQTVQALAQTEDGSLWIGTKGGLLRFAGDRFVIYNREIAPSLVERGVNCLLASRDGSLWIGTEGGGLVRYQKGQFQSYPTSDGFTNGFIRAIYEDLDGTVWVGGDQGLFLVAGSSMIRIDGRQGTPPIFVRVITKDQQGHIWIGGSTLLEFQGKSFTKQYPLPGGPSGNPASWHVCREFRLR
jgi:ligand-binding sensor domain-containing protein